MNINEIAAQMLAQNAQIIAQNERMLAQLEAAAPAKVTPPTASPQVSDPDDFVTWLRATGEARATRKAGNKELSAWLKSKDLPIGGPVWAAAKGGNRSVRSLRSIAKKAAQA